MLHLFLIVLLPAPLWPQSNSSTAVIQGIANDPTGASIPAAHVVVRNQDTGAERATAANANGRFSLSGLPPGTYTLRIAAPGFASATVKPFLLSVGQVVTQRIELLPAGLNEKIEVKEALDGIDVTAATASVALGNERIEEAPARSRNYLNFVLASPAVAPSAGTSSQRTMTGIRTPMGDSGFTFGGMRPRNNAVQIDGLDNRDETTGGNRVAVGLEMVQEFRVAGTSLGVELGGAAGGLLNMVTRSGTNIWHGDVTMFAQHERPNARQPEISTATKARFRRYQPGISANGPLRRNHTFISGAIEHERESAEEWSNVPEDAVDALNRALASPLYSASALKVRRGLYPTSTRGTELSAKLNHQASQKDTFSARYAFSRGRVRAEVQGPDNFADQSAQGSSLTVDHSLVGNWLRVISPTVVNDLRFQLSQRSMELRPNARGPMFDIPGVAALGQFHRLDADRTERHYQLVESLSSVFHGHRIGIGADLHSIHLDASLRNRYAGVYVFPALLDFQRGRPDVFLQAFGDPRTNFRTLPIGLWLQDRWELLPRLSLELGVRFDRQRMPAGISPSSNNLAPRAGLAWKPMDTSPLVFRLGFGLFYDRYPLAFLNDALQKDGVHGFEQYVVGEEAARALALSRGAILSPPLAGAASAIYRTSSHLPSSYARKLSAGAEYALDKNSSISVEASHIRGFHLPRTRNVLGTLPPLYELEQTARSGYLGASVTWNRRMSHDLAYLVTYTAGRTNDDGSDFDEHPLDPLHIRRDWAPSRQHQSRRLALSAVYEAFEGLSFAPIFSLGSGRPINALLTTDVFRTGAYPLSARPPGMPRNPFRSPSAASLDLRVMKTFHVRKDRAVLQFGIESFNLMNHANLERVSQFYSAPNSPLRTYGQILESLPARQIQFLMQFEY
ncbi:MAG: TonB-dependent receptor [Acidobacteria bacterium]|nr:TonB-dependent receptor [Acidobacteriota bacterium]